MHLLVGGNYSFWLVWDVQVWFMDQHWGEMFTSNYYLTLLWVGLSIFLWGGFLSFPDLEIILAFLSAWTIQPKLSAKVREFLTLSLEFAINTLGYWFQNSLNFAHRSCNWWASAPCTDSLVIKVGPIYWKEARNVPTLPIFNGSNSEEIRKLWTSWEIQIKMRPLLGKLWF